MANSVGEYLPVDVKRQVIYASLLRFAGEAQSLRDRAIDRLVLAALADTTAESPAKLGQIQSAVRVGPTEIRTEAIHTAVRRLEGAGLVDETRVRLKRAYFLTPRGVSEVQSAAGESVSLLDAVMTRSMRELPPDLSPEVAAAVFRAFICQCFARVGLEIAKSVTGRLEREDLLRLPQIISAFKSACSGHSLSSAAVESLEARCSNFLRSTHPDDERLKLHLTQGYFFTQLLGIHADRFDPLAEQAFAGAVLYVDTNAVMPRLLRSDAAAIFDEMVTVAKQLGIEMRITRATLDEIRRVAADRRQQLAKIVDIVPDALMHRAEDEFVSAFLERRDQDGMSLDEFFAPFENLSKFFQNDLGIELVDLVEEEMRGNANVATIEVTIQEESEAVRHRKKSPRTLEHDVAHFVHVSNERGDHPKTWFLTRDRSLIRAAERLVTAPQPQLCFSLSGFLQTISPFVTSGQAQHSLADVFSSILSDQLGSREGVYELDELVVLADLHEDVLATRDENLVQAIDIVRTRTLKGEPFRAENAQRTALALKKYLSSSTSERERASIGERDRLRGALAEGESRFLEEAERRAAAETEAEALRNKLAAIEGHVDALTAADNEKRTRLDALTVDIHRRDRLSLRNSATIFTCIGIFLVARNSFIAGTINTYIPHLGPYWTYVVGSVRACGLLLIAVPWTFFIRRGKWSNDAQTAALVGLYALVYALFPGVQDGWTTIKSDPLFWIALIVSVVSAFVRKKEH